MLQIIDKNRLIKKAQERFHAILTPFSTKKGKILIGGPGWHNTHEVKWSDELGIWWTCYELDNRYENSFGVIEPKWNSRFGHSVSCVIDVPFEGINRRIGGAFASDENELFLLHRGKIGGGRKDIGKTLFKNNYRGELVDVQDGSINSNLALVGSLSNERFSNQLADFVHEMQRIKNSRYSEENAFSGIVPEDVFTEEFVGSKEYSIGRVKAECDHGLVVNRLAYILKSKNYKTVNRRPFDLYVYEKDASVGSLFEIKTGVTTTDCYTAIGQLLVYFSKFTKKPKMYAVFPQEIREHFKTLLPKLGIELILYKWVNRSPNFENLSL